MLCDRLVEELLPVAEELPQATTHRHGGHVEEAEDAGQQAWVDLLEAARRNPDGTAAEARRIMAEGVDAECRRQSRIRRRERQLAAEAPVDAESPRHVRPERGARPPLPEIAATDADPSQAGSTPAALAPEVPLVAGVMDLDRLLKALEPPLTATQEEVLHLLRDEGLALRAIARRVGRDESSVRERLRRAVHRLRGEAGVWACPAAVPAAPRGFFRGRRRGWRSMYAATRRGAPRARLARALGLSMSALDNRLQRLRKAIAAAVAGRPPRKNALKGQQSISRAARELAAPKKEPAHARRRHRSGRRVPARYLRPRKPGVPARVAGPRPQARARGLRPAGLAGLAQALGGGRAPERTARRYAGASGLGSPALRLHGVAPALAPPPERPLQGHTHPSPPRPRTVCGFP